MRFAVAALALMGATLSPQVALAQGNVASMLPAEPKLITFIDDNWGTCSEEKRYFIGILFQNWGGDGPSPMVRLAEQAAAAYAKPADLLKFDDGHLFLRALEIRDYDGLQRFLKSLDDTYNMDVMVVAIPTDKRFASAQEQISAWEEIYIQDVAELGAKRCSARK